MSAADEAPGVGHLPCAHVWPLQMRSRRQRGLLSQQRPDQLADFIRGPRGSRAGRICKLRERNVYGFTHTDRLRVGRLRWFILDYGWLVPVLVGWLPCVGWSHTVLSGQPQSLLYGQPLSRSHGGGRPSRRVVDVIVAAGRIDQHALVDGFGLEVVGLPLLRLWAGAVCVCARARVWLGVGVAWGWGRAAGTCSSGKNAASSSTPSS